MRIIKYVLIAASVVLSTAGTAFAQERDPRDVSGPPGARLDTMPPALEAALDRFLDQVRAQREAAGSSIKPNANYIRGIQWSQDVVTVAFYGGNDATRAAIEEAAGEWTRHSGHFRFQFRDSRNRFLAWSPSDTVAAADIRISFDPVGYHSAVGRIATASEANESTMNLDDVGQSVERYAGNPSGWLRSYARHVIIHEFGHALGLSHEHFHDQCQTDILFDAAPGYRDRYDVNGYLAPDNDQRTPGALRYFESTGLPNVEFNLRASTYYPRLLGYAVQKLGITGTRQETPAIDRFSVMLYEMPLFVLRGAGNSPCVYAGGADLFATELSPGDIAYFRAHYDRRLPTRADAQAALARARAMSAR